MFLVLSKIYRNNIHIVLMYGIMIILIIVQSNSESCNCSRGLSGLFCYQ